MSGSLVCVGVGITLGAHISPISRSHIEQADKVYMLMSDGFVESWVASMNDNCESLQPYYDEGKSRHSTYQEMTDELVSAAQSGLKVVAAFYGHPGVFACVSHKAIAKLIELDIPAKMEAGISAEDCLYADLAIDPGKSGCIHYEASQFMLYKRAIDTAAHLILWQVGVAGDVSLSKYSTGEDYTQILVELLLTYYPADHEVILYEARTLPTSKMRIEKIDLNSLTSARLSMQTTLVIPPCTKLMPNNELREKLKKLDNPSFLTLVQ
ncbi:hypothetical protein DXX93_06965 [Thalassotalea euphylliae]|uniref:Tetrapyrrole methylase domain-containing protein n=1 Tax=Thalassotalea euphylliae TaxID=1655234 RepID=A0A3E0TPH9_9GAMM|nr:SAM-dependent methyltransferase [Thalassotalea euphylliae]REL26343.1 hypothetical protein DXX93_06965 [Thalassotalea euphylliae]